jgi:sirohydrochlorin cobaltochelatase
LNDEQLLCARSNKLCVAGATRFSYIGKVARDDFSDAVLVVFGHGSTVNEQSSAPVFQHAAELRRQSLFKEVREGFWKQEPFLKQILQNARGPRVFLAPLFISDGYFSEQVIPAELGFRSGNRSDFQRVLKRTGQTLYYCRAIGSHPSMTRVVLDRARQILEQFPFPAMPKMKETTLFIAAHGTEQNSNSRAAIDLQVERIRGENIYAEVRAVFLDQEPRLPECYQLCQTRHMVVVPFFISDGMHVREDIPVLLGEPERVVRQRLEKRAGTWRNPTEKQGKLVWYAQTVGTDPLVSQVILERVREAAHLAA